MRQLILQRFEQGLKETLSWNTDVRASVNNTEMRVAPRVYPSEELSFEVKFGQKPDLSVQTPVGSIVNAIRQLTASQGEFTLPMWHLKEQIVSQGWESGTQELVFELPVDSPFVAYVGEQVLLVRGEIGYVATLTDYWGTLFEGVVDFGENIGGLANFSTIIPLRNAFATSATSHTVSKFGAVATDSISCRLERVDNRTNLNLSSITLNTDSINQAPILERHVQSAELSITVEQGTNYINTVSGKSYYKTHWTEPANTFQITDSFQRRGSKQKLSYWRKLLDTINGSQGLFWVPTRRDDFELIESLGFGVRFRGRAYYDFWSQTNQRALCLDKGDALKVVQVLDCELDLDGNTVAQFSTPIDSWGVPTTVSLVFLCRLSDGRAEFLHNAQRSSISLKLTTVKYQFPTSRLPTPVLDVRADDVETTVNGSNITYIPNRGSIAGSFIGFPNAQLSTWEGRRSAAFLANNELRSNLSAASWDWLVDSNESFIISFRYECVQDGTLRVLFESSAGTPIRLQIDPTGALTWIRRNRNVTTATNSIQEGNRYTIQILCTPSADTIYVNGISLAAALGAMSGAVFTGTIRISRALTADSMGEIPHIQIHRFRPMASQIARIRQTLEDLWPDYQTPRVWFHIDASSGTQLVGTAAGSVQANGSNGGVFQPVFDRPLTISVNGRTALRPDKIGDFSEAKLPNVIVSSRLATDLLYSGDVDSLGGPPLVSIFGRADENYPHLQVVISTAGVIGLSQFDYSIDNGVNWETGLQTAPEVTIGPFTVEFPYGDYNVINEWQTLAAYSLDHSGNENHMRAHTMPILPIHNAVNNQIGYTPLTNSRFVVDTLSEVLTGDLWLAVVGMYGIPFMFESCIFGDESGRMFGFDDFGYPFITSTNLATASTPIPNNTPYAAVVQWTATGAGSQIRVSFDTSPNLIQETVDCGVSVDLTKFGFGSAHDGSFRSDYHRESQLILGKGTLTSILRDSLDNWLRFVNGFDFSRIAHRAFLRREPNFKNWSFLHNGFVSYRLSCMFKFEEESFSGTLLQTRHASTAQRATLEVTPSGILRYTISNLSTSIAVQTTLTGPFTNLYVAAEFILDVAAQTLKMYINGSEVHSVSTSSFSFSTADTQECELGLTWGLSLCEFECSDDLTLKSAELLAKWEP